MSDNTGIEWTNATWNPTTGCDKVSPGCDYCYAMSLAPRLKAMGSAKYQTDGDPRTSGPGFGVATHDDSLNWPLRKKKPLRIFVNSMSDLFHDEVPDEFIAEVFAVMAIAQLHTFQILTKRHGRMRSLLRPGGGFVAEVSERVVARNGRSMVWPLANVWLGVSVENQQWADIRIPALLDTPAAVRFLSMEPLLGPVNLCLCGRWGNPEPHSEDCAVVHDDCWLRHANTPAGWIPERPGVDWIIVGGESGPGARPMCPEWARALRNEAVAHGVPFLFKQWGEWVTEDQSPLDIVLPATSWRHLGEDQPSVWKVGKKAAGRELDGRTWDEFPEAVTTDV